MGSNKGTIIRRTAVVKINISQQATQNINWQRTKNIYRFLSQQTEDVWEQWDQRSK